MFFDPHDINEDKCKSKKYYYTNVWQIKRERVRGKDGKIIAKDFDNIPADAVEVIKNIKDEKCGYTYLKPIRKVETVSVLQRIV